MDENNGVDVGQKNVPSEEENLQNEENSSEEQTPDAVASDEPAADSSSPKGDVAEKDAEAEGESDPLPDENEDSAEVGQEEQAALLNQEDVVDESAADAADAGDESVAEAGDEAGEAGDEADVDSGSSGLLSQEEIDNAIEQGQHGDSDEAPKGDGEDAGDDGGMSQEEIDAAINSAVGDLGGEDLTATDQQPEVKSADFQQLSSSNKDGGQRNIDLLMDVELPVSIELGKTKMNISDILALGPGSVVELEKLVGEPVDLLVNNKCVARGEVVVVEENFGLRITQLISPEERIKNLQ